MAAVRLYVDIYMSCYIVFFRLVHGLLIFIIIIIHMKHVDEFGSVGGALFTLYLSRGLTSAEMTTKEN